MFRPGEPLFVLLGVVLALQGRVARVVPLEAHPLGGRDALAGLPALVGRPVAVEVDQHVLDDVARVLLPERRSSTSEMNARSPSSASGGNET